MAEALKEDVAYLWPRLDAPRKSGTTPHAELIRIYPQRSDVPLEAWRAMFERAQGTIEVMVYAAVFLPAAAVREVKEETGYDVEITGLVGTYTDPRHVIAYDDGEVRRQFNVCFRARLLDGDLAVSDESTAVRWIGGDELDELPMHHTQLLRLRHAFREAATPCLG